MQSRPPVSSFSSLLAKGDLVPLLALYDSPDFQLPKPLGSSMSMWNRLLSLCAREGRSKRAFSLYSDMKKRGLAPNMDIRAALIEAHSRAAKIAFLSSDRTQSLMDVIEKDTHKYGLPDLSIRERNALLSLFLSQNRTEEAYNLFGDMRKERKLDAASYSIMVNYFADTQADWDSSRKAFEDAKKVLKHFDLGLMHAFIFALSKSPSKNVDFLPQQKKRWRINALSEVTTHFFAAGVEPTVQTLTMILSVLGRGAGREYQLSVSDIDTFVMQHVQKHSIDLDAPFYENLLDKLTLCHGGAEASEDLLNKCWSLYEWLLLLAKKAPGPHRVHPRPLHSLALLAASKGDADKVVKVVAEMKVMDIVLKRRIIFDAWFRSYGSIHDADALEKGAKKIVAVFRDGGKEATDDVRYMENRLALWKDSVQRQQKAK
jgi:pentatricopeptide repeat protein